MENKINLYLPSLAGVRVLEAIQNGAPPVRAFLALCKCATQLIPPILVAYLVVTSKIKEKPFKLRQKNWSNNGGHRSVGPHWEKQPLTTMMTTKNNPQVKPWRDGQRHLMGLLRGY